MRIRALTERVRHFLTRSVGVTRPAASTAAVFNLGDSGGSDIARDKHLMIGEAVAAARIQGPDRGGDVVR